MTALSIQPPFPILTDRDGSPLEAGYIWIGAANLAPQTNPIAVYWDAALTQAATQPIRTAGGYPVNSGTPARLYVDSDYSILVQNRKATTVYSAPSATERLSNVVVSMDATQVSFLQAGTGAVTRTAQDKMRDVVSFKDFNAVGDGIANDTTAVLNALNSGARVVDGGGLTYKLTANIAPTSQNIVVQNATFDVSSITGGGSAISFTGTQAAGVTLTANTLTGSNSITVGSTSGFVADTYAWLASTTVFSTNGSVVLGQIVKIKSVNSGTSITLYEDVLYDFTTAASASIARLTPKENIRFQGVKFIGANTGTQTAVDFDKCVDVIVDSCAFEYLDYVSVQLARCVNCTVTNNSMRYARSVGLAYGIAIGNGCYNVKISNCYGEDTRHLVTVGDNDGVNLFVTVTNCHAASSKEAGIDAHPACDYMVIDGNTVECIDGTATGIIFQGLNCVITNNTVVGNLVNGIFHQMLPNIGSGGCVISGNNLQLVGTTGGTDTAIYVLNDGGGATMNGAVVSSNRISGASSYGIYAYAETGDIQSLSISANLLTDDASSSACFLRAAASYSIENFSITGNVFLAGASANNVYLLGTTAPNILNGTISGNTILGGTNGIRMIQTQNVVETGNYNTGTTRKVFVDTGSSAITMDRRQSSVVTMTNSTYTVLDQDEFLIANRAGTLTLSIPSATLHFGRELTVKTVQAQAVNAFAISGVATTAATGNGTTATISFAAQALATPVGSTVVIAGVTPAGYNGTHVVTASTTSSVSYASTETAAQTVAGTVTLTPQIVPVTDTVAGTAILPATDGAWALLKSDGTNWITMQRG